MGEEITNIDELLDYAGEEFRHDILIYIKENNKKKKFVKPTIEEIKNYCIERKNNIDAEYFYDHYETTGWMVGKNHMKDWKAAIRTWERNSKKYSYSNYQNSNGDSKEWI